MTCLEKTRTADNLGGDARDPARGNARQTALNGTALVVQDLREVGELLSTYLTRLVRVLDDLPFF